MNKNIYYEKEIEAIKKVSKSILFADIPGNVYRKVKKNKPANLYDKLWLSDKVRLQNYEIILDLMNDKTKSIYDVTDAFKEVLAILKKCGFTKKSFTKINKFGLTKQQIERALDNRNISKDFQIEILKKLYEIIAGVITHTSKSSY